MKSVRLVNVQSLERLGVKVVMVSEGWQDVIMGAYFGGRTIEKLADMRKK